MQPQFKNDDSCAHCRFLGQLNGEDIWLCKDTVMRRYGDVGEEYHSAPVSSLGRIAENDASWVNVQRFIAGKSEVELIPGSVSLGAPDGSPIVATTVFAGHLLVATENGIFRWDGQQWQPLTFEPAG
jgi:hypothetical protein